MELIFLTVLLLVVAFNIMVTRFLRRVEFLTKTQVKVQTYIVWLLPIVGGVLVWQVNRAFDDKAEATKPDFGGGHGNTHKSGRW